MKREDAVQAIADFMWQLTEGAQEALMVAIPELSEYRDARIRRSLLAHFSRYQPEELFSNTVTMKEVVDYIESLPSRPEKELIEEIKKQMLDKAEIGQVCHENDMHSWIDFDKKLLFDEGERVKVLVLETI
jgi:hypothetical protein